MGQASKALWWWLVALAVVAAVAVAAVWDRAGTAARLRREFGLDRTEASSEEAVAAGLQRRVPLGSDRRTIELFLRQSLDGDKHSMVEFVDQGREHRGYLCTFGYDVAEVGLVKETYHIWFAIDDAGVLKGISVTKTLTGL